MDNTAPDRQWVTCPGCAEAFDPDTESAPARVAGGTVQCPFCSTRFVPGAATVADAARPPRESGASPAETPATSGMEAPFVIEDDTDAEAEDAAAARRRYYSAERSQDLSTRRVRDLSSARRALLRIRSWCVVATGSFTVAAVQLGLLVQSHLRHTGWFWKPAVYALLLPGAIYGAVHFARRAAAVNRELRRPTLPEPEAPPDFSTLGDGGQPWKKLEEM
jgi:hypothetical protein